MAITALAITASAQEVRLPPVNLDEIGELRIVEGTIMGDGIVDYQVAADLFFVRFGDERYEIPAAAVNGG